MLITADPSGADPGGLKILIFYKIFEAFMLDAGSSAEIFLTHQVQFLQRWRQGLCICLGVLENHLNFDPFGMTFKLETNIW